MGGLNKLFNDMDCAWILFIIVLILLCCDDDRGCC